MKDDVNLHTSATLCRDFGWRGVRFGRWRKAAVAVAPAALARAAHTNGRTGKGPTRRRVDTHTTVSNGFSVFGSRSSRIGRSNGGRGGDAGDLHRRRAFTAESAATRAEGNEESHAHHPPQPPFYGGSE